MGAVRGDPGRPVDRVDIAVGLVRIEMTERPSKHILVVNDTEEILDLFRDILEGMGHRMTAWSFSPDDLAKVTELEPDLIILDLMIGPTELQGWALLQKIRMSPPTEEIPVIVCSAATNWVREQEGWLAANGVKVVLKPFKVAHLEHADRADARPARGHRVGRADRRWIGWRHERAGQSNQAEESGPTSKPE